MIHRNAEARGAVDRRPARPDPATTGRLTWPLASVDVHRIIQHAAEVCRAELDGIRARAPAGSRRHRAPSPAATPHGSSRSSGTSSRTPSSSRRVAGGSRSAPGTRPSWMPDDETSASWSRCPTPGSGSTPIACPGSSTPFEQRDPEHQRSLWWSGPGLAISRSVRGPRRPSQCLTAPARIGARRSPSSWTAGPAPIPLPSRAPLRHNLDGQPRAGGPADPLDRGQSRYPAVSGRLLRKRGHQVNPAPTSAPRKLANANVYDLIISDIELPDGSGLDIIRELDDQAPTPRHCPERVRDGGRCAQSLHAGFTEHLTKPIDVRKLDAAIARVAAAKAP